MRSCHSCQSMRIQVRLSDGKPLLHDIGRHMHAVEACDAGIYPVVPLGPNVSISYQTKSVPTRYDPRTRCALKRPVCIDCRWAAYLIYYFDRYGSKFDVLIKEHIT